MKCKFCDENESVSISTFDEQAGSTIQHDYDNRLIISAFIKNENQTPLGVACLYKINYCPYCGKELNDEKSKEN